MRKLLVFTMILLSAVMGAKAQSRLRFGVQGGLNLSGLNIQASDLGLESSTRAGFYVGPSISYPIFDMGLSLNSALMYSQEKSSIGLGKLDVEYRMHSMMLPINVQFNFPVPRFAPFVFGGPEFNFRLNDNSEDFLTELPGQVDAIGESLASNFAEVKMNVGAGINIAHIIDVYLSYNFGLTNTLNDFQSKQRSLRVGAVLYFN